MFDDYRNFSGGERKTQDEVERFTEILIAALKDLHSINKELKYMSWLKMIELKSRGMYTDDQMIKDFKDFDLDGI